MESSKSRSPSTGESSWWERHWVWVLVAGVGFCVLVFGGTLIGGIVYWMRSSVPFRMAIERLDNHPESRRLLGSGTRAGWFVTGNLSFNADGSGRARFQIPVSGPRGSGNLIVVAEKTSDRGWSFRVLKLVPDRERPPLNLLDENARSDQPPGGNGNRGARPEASAPFRGPIDRTT